MTGLRNAAIRAERDRVLADAQRIHGDMRDRILVLGESFYKRHGQWVRLNLYDDVWLIMDSWNQHIDLVRGAPQFENGHAKTSTYEYIAALAGNFGGFELRDFTMLRWASSHLPFARRAESTIPK